MDTVLLLADGRRVNALILSVSTESMRVVIPGHSDTVEFRKIEGGWCSERGVRMEIGALLAADGLAAHILPQAQVRTLTA
jgi:hypothetical protein